jgi:hypothetical protein
MTDWRKLIGKKEQVVLPYFVGPRVRMKDREVRLTTPLERAGWYRFEVEGRQATPIDAAEPELAGLTKVRGTIAYDVFFASGAPPERVAIMPADEPPLFASCACFRWHSGELVFGELDFEGEVDEEARRLFADRKPLEWAEGVPATVRAAFAWATVRRTSTEKDIPCSPREVWPHTAEIAQGGPAAAEALLERFEELRHRRRIIVAGKAIRVRAMVERAVTAADATLQNADARANAAIDAAGGQITSIRHLAAGRQLEVHFNFDHERFVTLVDAFTLQVIDAGICLIDHGDGRRSDEDLTLDSLPAAIREAIEAGELVITNHG